MAPVLILARFQKSPTAYCHRAAKRGLRYLRGTHTFGLQYNSGSYELQTYVDADYSADRVDQKSISGYMVKLGESLSVWSSKKQAAAALSTCESEYHAMTLAAKDTIWVMKVLKESGLEGKEPVLIRSDNQSAIN